MLIQVTLTLLVKLNDVSKQYVYNILFKDNRGFNLLFIYHSFNSKY